MCHIKNLVFTCTVILIFNFHWCKHMKIQHTPFPQGTVWQPEDPYLPVNLLWKMTKCNKDLAEVGLWAVHNRGGVTVIRISLWLTRWARRSLKSQGSRLRRPPSNTSPHFTGPTSFYYQTRPFFLSPVPPSLSFSLCPLSTPLFLRSIKEMKNGVQLAEYFLPLVGVSSSLCW